MTATNRIKECRDYRGLSADEVARRCGWHAHKLLKMERGERFLLPSDLDAIGRALDVEPYDLLNNPADIGWQDITSCPTEYGSTFLLWDGIGICLGHRTEAGMIDAVAPDGDPVKGFTCWMPLPNPPRPAND